LNKETNKNVGIFYYQILMTFRWAVRLSFFRLQKYS